MDILLVVRFLLAWAGAHSDLAPSEDFPTFGRTLFQMVSWCQFPEPLHDLFSWLQILMMLSEAIAMNEVDDTFILLRCSRKWPGSGQPPPRALNTLLRMQDPKHSPSYARSESLLDGLIFFQCRDLQLDLFLT